MLSFLSCHLGRFVTKSNASLFIIFFVFSFNSMAQKKVSGTVNSGDSVLEGVTVHVKGGAISTVTDASGKFTIFAPSNGTLVFSFVGYGTYEEKIGNRSNINIQMNTTASQLGDVVVVGYGTQAKKDLTGSIATINDEMVRDRPIASLNEGLVGQIPGVDISLSDATPGGEVDVNEHQP